MSNVQLGGSIRFLRGQRVMLDHEIAALYGISTKRLKEQVRRNPDRFPADFMFELDREELARLRSQYATSKKGRGGTRYRPFAFTEQGVAMLSSVLTSQRAISVNIEIMRAFVRMRRLLETNKDLAHRIDELERKYDGQFDAVFQAIRRLMTTTETETKKKRIGF